MCHEQAPHAGWQHRLGLAEFRTGETARPGGQLLLSDRDHLVRLDVRPEFNPMLIAHRLHAANVGRQLRPVDEYGGRGEGGQGRHNVHIRPI